MENFANAVLFVQRHTNLEYKIKHLRRVEISNPVGIPSELSEGDFGKKSVTRKSVNASLLHRIDYIKKIGSGKNRIKDAIEEHGKATVEFKLTDFFTVIFKRKEAEMQ